MPKAGPLILHKYEITVSIESPDDWRDYYLDWELPHNTKLSTVLAKVERAVEMSGYTMTQDAIYITRGKRIPREDTP